MSSQKLPQIVEVEWVDSVGSVGWRGRDERIASTLTEDMDHRTAGYLLKVNKNYVIVAQSVGDYNPTVADTIQIPRRAIKRIVKIKRA